MTCRMKYRLIAVPEHPRQKIIGRPRKNVETPQLVLINFKVNEKERKELMRRAKEVTGGNLSEYMRIAGTMPSWVFAFWARKLASGAVKST